MLTNLDGIEKKFKNLNYTVAALSIAFGIGSWLGVNSTFVQMPLFVKAAPEEWKLPSYMGIINQCGNIGPLLYTTLSQRYFQNKIQDELLITTNLTLGILASLLMIFFHGFSISIAGGRKYSIPLFVLFFCLSLIGCTSSVLFMPYMGRFQEIYLIMYFIGEGLSGLLASVVGLIQGIGGNEKCMKRENFTLNENFQYELQNTAEITSSPRFNSTEYFIFVTIVMIISLISFLSLKKLNRCKKEYIAVTTIDLKKIDKEINENQENETDVAIENTEVKLLSPRSCKYLLLLMFVISFFEDGVLASIQSYSCLPYGNIAYHLTISFTLIVNPISALSAIFLPKLRIRQISIVVIANTILGLYILSTAIMSPNPVFTGTNIGTVIIVFAWTIFIGIFTFIKINISTVMRLQGGKSLVWTGASSQLGLSVGAVIIFYFVNFTNIFIAKDPCS